MARASVVRMMSFRAPKVTIDNRTTQVIQGTSSIYSTPLIRHFRHSFQLSKYVLRHPPIYNIVISFI